MDWTILGVYSTNKKGKIGSGGTRRQAAARTYWLAMDTGSGLRLQALSPEHLPTPVTFPVDRERFLQEYEPEPGLYTRKTLPALRTLLVREYGEDILRDPSGAVRGKLEPVRRLGLAQKNEQETLAFLDAFLPKLLAGKQALVREQRSRINSQGISLRKQGSHDAALQYYAKALELNPHDDHLHFNMARIHHEKGDREQAMASLDRALALNPGLEAAKSFRTHLERTGNGAGPKSFSQEDDGPPPPPELFDDPGAWGAKTRGPGPALWEDKD
jgi:tetratricopeptide (TPR) repeat protein